MFKQNQKDNFIEYYNKHKYDLQRNKIIKNISNGNTTKPTQTYILKYNLKQNEKGEWY